MRTPKPTPAPAADVLAADVTAINDPNELWPIVQERLRIAERAFNIYKLARDRHEQLTAELACDRHAPLTAERERTDWTDVDQAIAALQEDTQQRPALRLIVSRSTPEEA